jgi:hypothetical protein
MPMKDDDSAAERRSALLRSAARKEALGLRRSDPERAALELQELARSLRLAFSAVVVCAGALRHQNAEMDEEIALVLKTGCSDRLDAAIEGIEVLCRKFPRTH